MQQLKTAVVILNWNGRALLEQFLPSVVEFSEKASVYVADNASTDDSVAFVKQNFPQVRIIQNSENGGYARGYNQCLKNLSEDIFILLNSDVKVTENWLQPIISIFENSEETAAVQPKILDLKKPSHFEYAGAAGGFIDKFGYPFCRGRIFDVLEEDLGQYPDETEIFWASGACLAIRKEVFFEMQGFDEDFFAHQEEIDLCWRIKNHGHKIKYTGHSAVFHLGGGTLNSLSPRKSFFNFRNSLFSLLKNVPGTKVWLIICCRLILDGIAGAKFAFQGKIKHTAAIIKAHFSFYANCGKMLRKRKHLPKKRGYYEVESVVWRHFIGGKDKFSDL